MILDGVSAGFLPRRMRRCILQTNNVSNNVKFTFGQTSGDGIEIDVQGYEQSSAAGEYWDNNWLSVEIRVRAGGFRGNVSATFLTTELAKFLSELVRLHDKLKGTAEFKTMEEQLSLNLTGDGVGHIELVGEVLDQAGIGNRLRFGLQFDQTYLAHSIVELKKIVSEFPVRSS